MRAPLRSAVAVLILATSAALVPPATAQTLPARAYVADWGSATVSVIDLATDTVVATVPVGQRPRGVAVTPDGTRVYVSNEESGTVSVIDTFTNAVVATVPVGQGPIGLRVTPDGTQVWVANSRSGDVSVIDTATNTPVATVPVGRGPTDIAISPDGSRAYVSAQPGDVFVVDTSTRSVVATVHVGDFLWGIEVLPDGSKVYVTHILANAAAVIDTATNAVVASIPVGAHPTGLALSPDGRRLYVSDLGTGLWVIDTVTDTATHTDVVSKTPDVAVSPNGERIYVTHQSPQVTVLDATTLTPVRAVAVGSFPEAIAIAALRRPVIDGSTWYSSGAKARSGPAGSTVALYAVGATPGVPYRLVLSRTSACADLVAFPNPTTVSAGPNGLIGTVRGTIPAGTPAGKYTICFRHTAGATATGVVTFTVT